MTLEGGRTGTEVRTGKGTPNSTSPPTSTDTSLGFRSWGPKLRLGEVSDRHTGIWSRKRRDSDKEWTFNLDCHDWRTVKDTILTLNLPLAIFGSPLNDSRDSPVPPTLTLETP